MKPHVIIFILLILALCQVVNNQLSKKERIQKTR